MKFKPGQEIVCIDTVNWGYFKKINFLGWTKSKRMKTGGPKKNEIVTVEGYLSNDTYVMLKEYAFQLDGEPFGYNEKWFAPVVPQSEINEVMAEIEATQKP